MRRLSLYLPDDLYEKLRARAFKERTKMTKIVEAALEKELAKKRS